MFRLLLSGWFIGLLVFLGHPSALVFWAAALPVALLAWLVHSLVTLPKG